MTPSLLFLLFSLLTLNGSFVTCGEVLMTSSSKTVAVGGSVKLRCELKNMDTGAQYYWVYFFQENHGCIAFYFVNGTARAIHYLPLLTLPPPLPLFPKKSLIQLDVE